ncbi:hypothetical protein [Bartonella machadoae]|uniref:hypothetical protein n=1 Tax=Bartonella machadoae TaxID=2893471 RepID=UPI001F4C7AD3|nr:hypothetical protein [Bartonella machadoae]UNE53710.1 hypothetical protein LNM86_08715 [Bartonella machadoae]
MDSYKINALNILILLCFSSLSSLSLRGIPRETLREISKNLNRDTVEALGESFARSNSPHDYVVDHSPLLQNLVFEILTRNPDAFLDLMERASIRAKGGGERIHQAADEHFIPRENIVVLKDDLIASRDAAEESLYEIAKKTPIGEEYYGVLNELMKRPYFKKAYDEGVELFMNGGNNVIPFSSQKFSLLKEKPDMGVLHETQDRLRFMIDTARKTGDDSKVSILIGILIGMREKLLEIMDDISSKYTKGRAIYHQYSLCIDAIDEGEKILSKTIDKKPFNKIFDELSEQQQEYFKKAAREALSHGIRQTTDQVSTAKQIFDSGVFYKRFAKIFGADKVAAVKKVVDREANYADLYNRIHGCIRIVALEKSWNPFKEAALKERERIEKDVVKLLTGGTKFSNDEIINALQRMV